MTRSATAAVKQLDAASSSRRRCRPIGSRRTERQAVELIVAVAGIGTLALLIALGGVAAIASHSVALRTREIGIRIALGARRGDAVSLIVRLALTPVAIGAIAGIGDRLARLARSRAAALWHQSAGSGVVHGTAVFLMLAAAAAAWLPARRAAGVDPILALRSE